jgi:hypothetical protein
MYQALFEVLQKYQVLWGTGKTIHMKLCSREKTDYSMRVRDESSGNDSVRDAVWKDETRKQIDPLSTQHSGKQMSTARHIISKILGLENFLQLFSKEWERRAGHIRKDQKFK